MQCSVRQAGNGTRTPRRATDRDGLTSRETVTCDACDGGAKISGLRHHHSSTASCRAALTRILFHFTLLPRCVLSAIIVVSRRACWASWPPCVRPHLGRHAPDRVCIDIAAGLSHRGAAVAGVRTVVLSAAAG